MLITCERQFDSAVGEIRVDIVDFWPDPVGCVADATDGILRVVAVVDRRHAVPVDAPEVGLIPVGIVKVRQHPLRVEDIRTLPAGSITRQTVNGNECQTTERRDCLW